jgi:putative methionine-R-sulfoxide reductase with GAF domain
MSIPDTFDRESLQSLFANAFSVQQSGMRPDALAAIIEIQHIISEDPIDADSAMNLVADRARAAGNASGIGIALLQDNQLVHRAGTGSASQFVGRQLTAVLAASVPGHPRREILRVENANADSRIEAEICRQFDAQALLMVPIYRDGIMTGVLEVLFSAPHHFDEPEVRTYQLMATLAGDASALQHPEERHAPSSTVSHALWRMISEIQRRGSSVQRIGPIADEHRLSPGPHGRWDSLYAKMSVRLQEWWRAEHFWQAEKKTGTRIPLPNLQKGAIQRDLWKKFARRLSWPQFQWSSIAVSDVQWRNALRKLHWRSPLQKIAWQSTSFGRVAWDVAAILFLLLVVIAASIARHHSTVSTSDRSSQTASTPGLPAPAPSSEAFAAGQVLKPDVAKITSDANAPNHGFKRVRIGKNEVDYVADDVTVRHFRSLPVPPTKTLTTWSKQVNLGKDVTVRYFSPSGPVQSQPAPAAEQAVKD